MKENILSGETKFPSPKLVSKDGLIINWHQKFSDVPQGPFILVAHEFFDALPIYKFEYTAQGWREILVDVDKGPGPHHLQFVLSPGPTLATTSLLKHADQSHSAQGGTSTSRSATAPLSIETTTTRVREDVGGVKIGDRLEVCADGLALASMIAERVGGPTTSTPLNSSTATATTSTATTPTSTATSTATATPATGVTGVGGAGGIGGDAIRRRWGREWSKGVGVAGQGSSSTGNIGAALIVDYGDEFAKSDTLRAVKGHKFQDPLAEPGMADLTADVDFAAIKRTAVQHGNVVCYGPVGQGDFLQEMGVDIRMATLMRLAKDEAQAKELVTAYERLVDKNQMGHSYKVLAICPKQLMDHAPPMGFPPKQRTLSFDFEAVQRKNK
jgi:SAM-dependent MidA family methyltransferase